MKARIQATLAMWFLSGLRWMLRGRGLEVHIIPAAAHASPRTQRRQLGKLYGKALTKGVRA